MATTTNVNPDTTPKALQTYALLQIAAEAFLGTTDRNDAAAPPTGSASFNLTPEMLTKGNLHSSKPGRAGHLTRTLVSGFIPIHQMAGYACG